MIYFDNASTTKPCEEAKAAAIAAFEEFGNPSSLHRLGLCAEKTIKNARAQVAALLGAKPESVYFTSGGTESNNTAVFQATANAGKKHVITTKIEHPSVTEPFARLEKQGFSVDYIGVLPDGTADMDELYEKLTPDTALVSMMYVNNETGTIQPVQKVRPMIDERAKGAFFHVDAVQAFGKIPMNVQKLGADFVSVSAHKINAVKGCGALYVGTNRFTPFIVGGGQQKGIRSGTENVPAIAAFGAAAEKHMQNRSEEVMRLRNMLKDELAARLPDVVYNGSENTSAYILNMSFLGIKAEILLHALEARGIYVSTGSACSSNKPQPSHVLAAMGRSAKEIGGAIRMSFDDSLCEEDIKTAADAICGETEKIRKYMR